MIETAARRASWKINRVAIRSVSTYAAETMSLTNEDEEKLKILERKDNKANLEDPISMV